MAIVGTTRRPDRSEQTFIETDPGRIVKRTVPVCARVGIGTEIGFPEIQLGLPGVTGKRFYEELKMQFLLHLVNYASIKCNKNYISNYSKNRISRPPRSGRILIYTCRSQVDPSSQRSRPKTDRNGLLRSVLQTQNPFRSARLPTL